MIRSKKIKFIGVLCVTFLAGILFIAMLGIAFWGVGKDNSLAGTNVERDRSIFPVRIRIPKLGIDAPIEEVGITGSGEMAVPSTYEAVGWYVYGAIPGEKGNSVLAGHLDTALGRPAVFWELKKISLGDNFFVEKNNGIMDEFVVVRMEEFDYQADVAVRNEIFGPNNDESKIYLITCTGRWIREARSYDKRLVVTAVPKI